MKKILEQKIILFYNPKAEKNIYLWLRKLQTAKLAPPEKKVSETYNFFDM